MAKVDAQVAIHPVLVTHERRTRRFPSLQRSTLHNPLQIR
jgi:hypothetical protein